MKLHRRIRSLDALRGLAVVFIILFHASIYNFANLHTLDFSDPPLIIILISFMALWGGIFIVYSMVVNSLMLARRFDGDDAPLFRPIIFTSAALLILHYALNIFLGRWNIDFVNNRPDMTFIASFIRDMEFGLPHVTKFFEGSSLGTIGINLLIISSLLLFLFKGGLGKDRRNYWILGSIGFFIMVFSFVRVSLYGYFSGSVDSGQYLASTMLSFLLSNPYPLLPYLAYGCFGAVIGLMIHRGRKDLLLKAIIPLGAFFLVFGVAGMANLEKTISTPDYFWFFKTNGELGIFMLIISSVYLLFEHRQKLLDRFSLLEGFSRICLTIYLSETLLSELLRKVITPLLPQWNQTIGGSLLFGCANIAIWAIIVVFWKRYDYRYSLEHLWVWLFRKIGKRSTRLSLRA